MWIKKKDKVVILSGRDEGKRGEVLRSEGKERFIVSKINIVKKHQKPHKDEVGGIMEKEAPLHQSKLMLLCPRCDAPVRPKIEFAKDGAKQRVCRRCSEVI